MRYPGILAGLLAGSTLMVSAGCLRAARYMVNFEEMEYGRGRRFREPASVERGLAVYRQGTGPPVLLFPYPHAATTAPMIEGPLAQRLVDLGRTVITFDVPGAYRSTRSPSVDMEEMVECAVETLDRFGINSPVDVIGHSMGGLCALAFTIEQPERVRSLILIGSLSGFPASVRWGMPGSRFGLLQREYWQVVVWGMRLSSGRGNLALHKRLQNLIGEACLVDRDLFDPVEIEPDDRRQGVPIRARWSRLFWKKLSWADRLQEIQVPVLVCTGRHDPLTPPPCSEELATGIPGARLMIFEHSGHAPFIEETDMFLEAVAAFYRSVE